MNDNRSREEILGSLQDNAKALGEDVGVLGHSLQESVSPVTWFKRNPAAAVVVGVGAVALTIMVIRAGRNKLFRVMAGGVASAVGSVFAAQIGHWVKTRVAEKLTPEREEV